MRERIEALIADRTTGREVVSHPAFGDRGSVYVTDRIPAANQVRGILVVRDPDPAAWRLLQSPEVARGHVFPVLSVGLGEKIALYEAARGRKLVRSFDRLQPSFIKKLDKALALPSRSELDALFDRSDVIEEFYVLYRKSRDFLRARIKGISDAGERDGFIDRFLLTLLTLWFLQERGFFAGTKGYLIDLFASYQQDLFQRKKGFLAVLRGWFDLLSRETGEPFVEDPLYGRLPVLGPALFLDDLGLQRPKVYAAIAIPDECFYEEGRTSELLRVEAKKAREDIPILNMLESRDWTEGTVDEYVLGAIYEKLITPDERARTGAHYTEEGLTRHIVHHTLDAVLLHQLNKELGEVSTVDAALGQATAAKLPGIFMVVRELRVCDPTTGSGHFLEATIDELGNRYEQLWRRAHELKAKGLVIETLDARGAFVRLDLTDIPLAAEERFRLYIKFFIILCRNIYGVDINPGALAVARARLFLTLAKHFQQEEDHFVRFPNVFFNLREGNSLNGYVQIPEPKEPKVQASAQFDLFTFKARESEAEAYHEHFAELEPGLLSALKERGKLLGIERDPGRALKRLDALLRERKLSAEDFREALSIREDLIRIAMLSLSSAEAGALRRLLDDVRRLFHRKLDERFAEEHDLEFSVLHKQMRSLHWCLEFPEVFARGGFDAVVGNPPFLRGKSITTRLGTEQREHIVNHLAGGTRGSADLCAYFHLRGYALLRLGGSYGMLGTNTIAQGDTREVGLDRIVAEGGTIIRANPSFVWPGAANVHTAIVFMHRGHWKGEFVLEGEEGERSLEGITPYLTPPGALSEKPYRLAENAWRSFVGSYVLGLGFMMTPEDGAALVRKNKKNAHCLYPCLNGEDLNTFPDQRASRWVINFFDWPLERKAKGSWFTGVPDFIIMDEKARAMAQRFDGTPSSGFTFYEHSEDLPDSVRRKRSGWLKDGKVPADYPFPTAADYPDLLDIVRRRVKPDRVRRGADGEYALRYPLYERWWQFADKRPALYETIRTLDRNLIVAQTANRWAVSFRQRASVVSHTIVAFAFGDWEHFALLQGQAHEAWRLQYGAQLKNDARYTPSDCFDTFPFPQLTEKARARLADIGERYHAHRAAVMLEADEGLTKTYNRFHSPDDKTPGIVRLRELHTELDRAVADAYGWTFPLGHGFHQTRQGLRYTVSNEARQEILDELLRLNHERHAEEEATREEERL